METILLQQIVEWLNSFATAFSVFTVDIMARLGLIETNTDELSEISEHIEGINSNVGDLVDDVWDTNSNIAAIKPDVTIIKTKTNVVKNNLVSITNNTANAITFAEDVLSNTGNIDNRLTTIVVDTTQIRANTSEYVDILEDIIDTISRWD